MQERAFIREQIAAGKDKEQIKAALVDEYGEEVLAEPERRRLQRRRCGSCRSRSSLLRRGRDRRRDPALARPTPARTDETELPPPLSAEDARRLDAELSR